MCVDYPIRPIPDSEVQIFKVLITKLTSEHHMFENQLSRQKHVEIAVLLIHPFVDLSVGKSYLFVW